MKITHTKHTFSDFPVGTRVLVVAEGEDMHFFQHQKGVVIRNSNGYLGIIVEFDKPMEYESGRVLKSFNFNPHSLCPIVE